MAVTITRYAGSSYDPQAREATVEYAGRVLSHRFGEVHVSSDHAWLDSGHRVFVTVWDDDKRVVREVDLFLDDRGVAVEDDAPAAVRAVADEYRQAKRDAMNVDAACRAARRWEPKGLKRGDVVEVFKGRKCPKGLYTVRSVRETQYGWSADLYEGADDKFFMAKVHQYVSIDNLRRPGDPWDRFDRSQVPAGWPLEFAHAVFDDAHSLDAWMALCDHLDERGDPAGDHVRNAILNGWIFGYNQEVNHYRHLAAGAELANA